MYAAFFGLRELPFNNTPDPRFFLTTPDHEEALASLIYAVGERKGFVLLTGEVGAGKTLISRMMLRHFGSRVVHAHVHHALTSADDLMESVAQEFELDVPNRASRTQRVRALHDFLLEQYSRNVPAVLVLDEAQTLPVDAFEQLRMIGNLEADEAKLLQIVIVGQPELRGILASEGLRQLSQRIFRSYHLSELNRDWTESYIRHRLTVAGAANADLFDSTAFEVIFRYSRGLPRVVNTFCDNALLSAYAANRSTIDGGFVESVIQHMSPSNGHTPPTHEELRPQSSWSHPASHAGRVETAPRLQWEMVNSSVHGNWVGECRRLAETAVLLGSRIRSLDCRVIGSPSADVKSPIQAAKGSWANPATDAAERRIDQAARRLENLRRRFLPKEAIGPKIHSKN